MAKKTDKIFFIFIIVAAAALSAVRFFQYMSLIDFFTGYYYKGSESGGALLYILMIASGAILIALAVVGNKMRAGAFRVSSDGMGKHATQYFGIAEIIAGVVTASPIFTSTQDVFSIIIMAIAGLTLAASGFIDLQHVVPPAITGHLKLVWAVYLFFRGAVLFNSDLTILNHSDTLIELTALLLAMIFAASLARFFARVETKLSRLREMIFAGLTFGCCAVHIIPKLIAYIAGSDATVGMRGINADAAAAMILSLTYLAVVTFTKKSREIAPIDIYEEDKKKKVS